MLRRVVHRVKVWLGFAVFWLIGRLPHRVRYARSPHIPRTGPALLVVNHLATTETLAVARLVIGHRRFPHFLIMAELFGWPVIGTVARWMKQIPVQRGGSGAADALVTAADELRKGNVVVIYPEGRLTREPDLRPGPAKSGAARLALELPAVPVIPIGQWGARPGLKHALRRRRVDLLVGAPIDLSAWRTKGTQQADQAAVVPVTTRIMAAITSLVEAVRGRPFAP